MVQRTETMDEEGSKENSTVKEAGVGSAGKRHQDCFCATLNSITETSTEAYAPGTPLYQTYANKT